MASQKKTSKMTLYQFPFYRSFKPVWLIHELGMQDDVKLVKVNSEVKDTEDFKEYHRTVHPHGTIPALVVEGEGTLLESSAICLYLADLKGKLAPPLDRRREYYEWIMYCSVTMEECVDFLYWQWMAPVRRSPDPEGVKKHVSKMEICIKRLNETLNGRQYLLGDNFSCADCIVGFTMWIVAQDSFNGGSLVQDFPAVKAYVERVSERPGFIAAVEAQKK